MTRYEITIEMPNGDWVWTLGTFHDVHELFECALDYAAGKGGRVHHVEKLKEVS